MKTAIIIPTYNEKGNLKKLIPAILSILPKTTITIVDDNSPDKTGQAVSNLQKKYKNLYLVTREKKSGRGSAVIEGLKYILEKRPDTEIFIEMDADFSHKPEELPQLIKLSKPKTIIFGSRYVKGSKIINWPIKRRIASKISNFLIRTVLNLPLNDNTNGYRCYHKDAVKLLVKHQYISQGYILLSESANLLYQNGFKFIEVPSVFYNRTVAKSNTTIFEFLDAFINLIRIRWKN